MTRERTTEGTTEASPERDPRGTADESAEEVAARERDGRVVHPTAPAQRIKKRSREHRPEGETRHHQRK
jgi:hypothetical protein